MDPSTTPTVIGWVKDLGLPVALVVYFLWKDAKFTERIVALMAKIDAYLTGGGKENGGNPG